MRINENYLRIPILIAYKLRTSLFRYTFMNTDIHQFSSGRDLTIIVACLSTTVSKKIDSLSTLLYYASSLAITVLL